MARLVFAAFVLSRFATPIHLAVETHDWHPETEEGDHHPSDHEPHPSADHELVAMRADVQSVCFSFEAGTIELHLPAPNVKTWVRKVEAEANSPPDVTESTPRSPRAPPF